MINLRTFGIFCCVVLTIMLSARYASTQRAWRYCGGPESYPWVMEVEMSGVWEQRAIDEIQRWDTYADVFTWRYGDGYQGWNRFLTPDYNEMVFLTRDEVSHHFSNYRPGPNVVGVEFSRGSTWNTISTFFGLGSECYRYVETDIVFILDRDWPWSEISFRATALHELGHALGRPHAFDSLSTMNYIPDDAMRYLTQTDARALRSQMDNFEERHRIRSVTDMATYPFRHNGGYKWDGIIKASVDKSTVQAGGTFRLRDITVENIGTRSLSDVLLNIYVSTNETISTSDYLIGSMGWDTFSNHYDTSEKTLWIPDSVPPGDYYIGARIVYNGYQEDSVGYNNSWVLPSQITVAPPDRHGGTPGTATSVGTDSSTSGHIASDKDVFRIVVPQAGQLTVETTGNTDTYGTLTRQGGEQVATDDDDGQDRNFQIVETLAAGTYFVEVRGYNDGPYTLRVSFEASDRSPARDLLENPGPGSFQSGIGVLSGWVCEATEVALEFHHGVTGTVFQVTAGYGTGRADTADPCGDTDNGFGLLFNWNLLGDGLHTVRALADGVEFARSTFTVTTLGLGAFPTGLSGAFSVPNFPTAGQTTVVKWQEAQQNFVIVSGAGGGNGSHTDRTKAVLENPGPGSFQSGIGVLSGWVCEATEVALEFHHGVTGTVFQVTAGYGTGRADTADPCGDTDNGFGLLFNWNLLGDGLHTVRALADGVEFARSTFTVTTLGLGAFPTGLSGAFSVPNFPTAGQTTVVKWQEAQQNFVIAEVQ